MAQPMKRPWISRAFFMADLSRICSVFFFIPTPPFFPKTLENYEKFKITK